MGNDKYKVFVDTGEFHEKVLDYILSDELDKMIDSTVFAGKPECRSAIIHGMSIASMITSRCKPVCIKEDIDDETFTFETIAQIKSHYCKPIKKYIICGQFGNCDSMDGGCHFCEEMLPIQFEMCTDASWLYSMTHRQNEPMTENEAIQFIENHKQKRCGMFEAELKHNYLQKRIGIWYKDKEWADKMFEEILAMFPYDVILKMIDNCSEKCIVFKDGSFIKILPATNSSRGTCLTDSYIQKGIDKEVYDTVISKCTKPNFKHSIVVDNIEDFTYGKSADRYYLEIMEE